MRAYRDGQWRIGYSHAAVRDAALERDASVFMMATMMFFFTFCFVWSVGE
jgi:hypothetical protein